VNLADVVVRDYCFVQLKIEAQPTIIKSPGKAHLNGIPVAARVRPVVLLVGVNIEQVVASNVNSQLVRQFNADVEVGYNFGLVGIRCASDEFCK